MDWEQLLKGTVGYDYDDWLEFFRTATKAGMLMRSQGELEDMLPPDGYAALQRWIEIFESPSRMDKLYRGRLDAKLEDDIMDVAVGDNDEEFYEALIRKNVTQINSSSVSQQEVARLSQNINIFRKELKEIRSRKPKAGSVLEKVLSAAAKGPVKKAPKTTKKPKSTPVKKKATASKAAGAPKKKKTGKVPLKAKK